jgi:hypothetical protein
MRALALPSPLKFAALGIILYLGGCSLPEVSLLGKACDLQHPCEDGYACGLAIDGGSICTYLDGGS